MPEGRFRIRGRAQITIGFGLFGVCVCGWFVHLDDCVFWIGVLVMGGFLDLCGCCWIRFECWGIFLNDFS